ncbi:hypothetical protein [Streptomyces olivochromogenes]|uniref:Uncharacterized protein n=1 Tax=Streptomyces olivochromogenes TaxID=1963 RepID=A0A250VDA5_STROL|nr:hypothetical protein [Streptomyces olivochromogenes]KUN44564.1 hypothetical protein AQJ27_24275 [Streptomyces olivochromogenes]GAX52145.1 hypothetical protein SO3561_03654 [Streptomyces olivochromogenes]
MGEPVASQQRSVDWRALALPEASYIGADHVYALGTSMFDELLSGWDPHAHGQVAPDELWAYLAEVHTEEGHTSHAMTCLERLERISDRMGGGRTRLRCLLASARALRQDAPGTAQENLREAVDLARSRGRPFETAVTLVAAAEAGVGRPTLLHEAYEPFGGHLRRTVALPHQNRHVRGRDHCRPPPETRNSSRS